MCFVVCIKQIRAFRYKAQIVYVQGLLHCLYHINSLPASDEFYHLLLTFANSLTMIVFPDKLLEKNNFETSEDDNKS